MKEPKYVTELKKEKAMIERELDIAKDNIEYWEKKYWELLDKYDKVLDRFYSTNYIKKQIADLDSKHN